MVVNKDFSVTKSRYLRRCAEFRVSHLVYSAKCKYDLHSLYFYTPVGNVVGYDLYPILTDKSFVSDWSSVRISSMDLMSIIRCLETNDFFGYCRTSSGELILIKPKKNVVK